MTAGGEFRPLGFAPHRPADARLVAAYRTAVPRLLEALDAVERLARRAEDGTPNPSAIGIVQVLRILDGLGGDGTSRAELADLDGRTTPPPWDPGHLVIGMELGDDAAALGIAPPMPGDPHLVAAARWAVPRALTLLAGVEDTVRRRGAGDGSLDPDGGAAIAGALHAFDEHDVREGYGTGTV